MEVRVTQSQVGKFNLLSNEESFCFYMAIFDDGKMVEVDAIPAIIHFSGDAEDAYNFQDPYGELDSVIEMCIDYVHKISSTRNYKAEAFLFCKTYIQNYDDINTNMKAKNKQKLEKQIKELQNTLNRDEDAVPDIEYALSRALNKQIQQKEKYLQSWEKDLAQLKEGTEKHEQVLKTIARYRKEIDTLYELKQVAHE